MKIGFIAMSGVRTGEAGLSQLDLSLPGFDEGKNVIASLPNLGLLTLAGMTPRHHEMSYVEIGDIDKLETLPAGFDLVAISSCSAHINDGYRLAERYRALGIPVVMGGLHVTVNPHEPALHGASAVIGEGEIVWPAIVADAERGELKPVYDARCREFNLADAPMPAYELLDIDRYDAVTVQTSRGCPWRCSFCAGSILLTKKHKQKPVAKVLAEIDRIRELWPRPFIQFADDNAFVNRNYWRELLPELKKRHIRWSAEADLSVHEDEELLHMMRQAGCVEVRIGFESPVPAGLDGLELRHNFKHERHYQSRRAIERIQAAGIRVNACFMLGLDGQGPWVFDAVLDFVRESLPFDVSITVPTAFPGTPFYGRLKREGRLLHDGAWERCTQFEISYRPQGMTVDQLCAGMQRLAVEIYGEDFASERREHFDGAGTKRQRKPSLMTNFCAAVALL